MKWQEIDRKLRASGFQVFTDREFRAVTQTTATAAKFMLIRYARRGLLCRLKRGLYAVKERMPSSWVVANQLYKPSYISLASALSYHGLIPESVYAVTSVTTKTTREFAADGRTYLYRSVKRAAFAGYRSVTAGEDSVLMAEPEKAVADHLYFVFLNKSSFNERLALDRVNRRKLVNCLTLFGNPRLIKWFRHDLKVPDRRTAR